MKFLQNIENKLQKLYRPKKAPWKRKFLFILSISILVLLSIGTYYQLNYSWTNDGIWLIIGLFLILSSTGLFISIFGNDFLVALVLGRL